MINARQLYKSFGSLAVLKGVDVQIEKGEVIAIVGPSGAGKTTLLQILSTLDKPDVRKDCSLECNHHDLLNLREKALSKFRNQHIGFVFQFHQLLPEFTALENVCIPAMIAKKSKRNAEEKAAKLLRYLGLENRLHHKPNELSGGEQQRVAVARALVNDPAIVFADEPSGNLDSKAAETLHALFLKLRREMGQTFVIVTHNKNLAKMADRTLEMRDGKIVQPPN
jgi:lipoprotein-releasing system ATP-binding protein